MSELGQALTEARAGLANNLLAEERNCLDVDGQLDEPRHEGGVEGLDAVVPDLLSSELGEGTEVGVSGGVLR